MSNDGDGAYTAWQLVPLPPLVGATGPGIDFEPPRPAVVKLRLGANLLGRSRLTRLTDKRLSREHCRVIVDAENYVWLSPRFARGDVIAVNDRICARADGLRPLLHQDVLCLWKSEVRYRLELAPHATRQVAADPCEAMAERVWAPPPAGSPAADACVRVLTAAEPGAEEATLLELYTSGFAGGPGTRADVAAHRVGGAAAIAARWPKHVTITFGAALLRHRKRYSLAGLELGVSTAELLAFQ